MMIRLPAPAAAAALLALSVHVFPVIGFAFPSPQTSSSTCVSECTPVLNTLKGCNISLEATTFTVADEMCMCKSSAFKSSVEPCFTCLGEPVTYEYVCSDYISGSASGTRSASASASATRTSGSATRTTSTSSPGATGSSAASCNRSDACVALSETLNRCHVTASDLQGDISDADMTCLCENPATFEANTANCLTCHGESTFGADKICDAYASSSGLGSGTARTTDSSATATAAVAGNPTTTSTGLRSTSTSTTGIIGDALSQNVGSRTVALGVPGLVVPVLLMAAAAWRVVF